MSIRLVERFVRSFVVAVGLSLMASSASAQPGEAPPADFQKQLDDALKELDKLEKQKPVAPEDANRDADDFRQKFRQQPPGFGNRIFINPIARIPTASRLGVILGRVSPVLRDHLELPAEQGLAILRVIPGSGAAAAGLQAQDILVEFDGKPVSSVVTTFQQVVAEAKPSAEVGVAVIREGKRESIKGVKLSDILPPPIIQNGAPGFGRIQLQLNGGESVRVSFGDESFTISYATPEVQATVKGTREKGQAVATDISIRDVAGNHTARSVEEVPERYRLMVERLMQRVR